MSRRVVVRRLARLDIARACRYCEEQTPGLGARLADRIDEILDHIAKNPLQFAAVHRDMRRAVLLPFSYALFYKADAKTVRVFAVIHTSRDPRVWQRRA
jgi:toxin ParE1/3/4